jgi:hypothetical protein
MPTPSQARRSVIGRFVLIGCIALLVIAAVVVGHRWTTARQLAADEAFAADLCSEERWSANLLDSSAIELESVDGGNRSGSTHCTVEARFKPTTVEAEGPYHYTVQIRASRLDGNGGGRPRTCDTVAGLSAELLPFHALDPADDDPVCVSDSSYASGFRTALFAREERLFYVRLLFITPATESEEIQAAMFDEAVALFLDQFVTPIANHLSAP